VVNGAELERGDAAGARVVVSGAWVLAAAAPLALVSAGAWAGVLAWEDLAAAWSVRTWAAAACLLFIAWAVRVVAARRWAAALCAGAVACVLFQAAASYAYRADAILDLGEGEGGGEWRPERIGPAARLPQVEVVSLPERGEGMAQLRVDGREVSTVIGREVSLGGRDTLVIRGAFVAPGFEVRRKGGAEEAAGYLKLVPGRREYFQVALLPHRFYLTLPPAEGLMAGAATTLRLSVQRGKQVVVPARDVALGEQVEFEGLTVKFQEGAPWARIEVHRSARRWLAAAAVALLGAAAALVVAERRRRA
jgi:hypothetical protein